MARMPQTATGAIVALVVTCCSAFGSDRPDPPRRQLQSNTPLVVIRKAFADGGEQTGTEPRAAASTTSNAYASFNLDQVEIDFGDEPAPHALRPEIREPATIQDVVVPAAELRPATEHPPAEASDPNRRTLGRRRLEVPSGSAAPPDEGQPAAERTGPRATPLTTIAGGLAIALGLFLLLVWVCRKAMPRSASRLPLEAVEVLGKAVLTPKQSIHLVRVGNKLVLLSLSPGGVEALTEITDAAEVEQVLAACQRRGAHSATAEFRQVLHQYHAAGVPTGAASALPQTGPPPAAAPQPPPFSLWENRHA